VTRVTSATSIMCSSVSLWALYFIDPAYQRQVLDDKALHPTRYRNMISIR